VLYVNEIKVHIKYGNRRT